MRLPMCFKGCGLREAHDRRTAQYIETMVQSVPALIDSIADNNCTVEGKLHIPCIVEMLEEHSFNAPLDAP